MAFSSPPLLKEAEVTRSLEKLKREPINTEGSQDSILAPIYSIIMSAPLHDDGALHWFCDKARPVVIEASTFLLRLHAYTDNPRVDMWKKKLAGVLHDCCSCVQGYIDAKASSRVTYFAAFSKSVLDNFFSTIDKWEASLVLNAVNRAGIMPGSKKTISDLPPAVLYHVLAAVPLFESPGLLCVLQDHPPVVTASGWPIEVPPGLLLLLFHEKNTVRTWAQRQMIGCSPIAEDKFVGGYNLVFQSITEALTLGTLNSLPVSDANRSSNGLLREYFTMSPSALWSGLQNFIQILPGAIMKSENLTSRVFCRAIIGHLHDQGSHFSYVLRAFIHLLKKHASFLWQGEDHDYAQVVFDSIKDNPAYLRLFQEADTRTTQPPWFVEWFRVYLRSLEDMPIFGDVLRKVVDLTCEELQHERFKSAHPMVMASILTDLYDVLQSTKVNDRSDIHLIIAHVIDIHTDIIVNVALSAKRNTQTWETARSAAQRLLNHTLATEASRAEAAVFHISEVVQNYAWSHEVKGNHKFRPPAIHEHIWKTMYETVPDNDSEAIILLLSLVARSAYLDALSSHAFNPSSLPTDIRNNFTLSITAVNAGLHISRAGFFNAITQYTSATSSTAHVVRSVVRRPDIATHLIALLLSPVEELQMASQTLLGQAYDVDVRSDCFRAILQDIPVAALEGLTTAVSSFNHCAPLLPEACSIAKSLVRCMTDVIEVLTNGHDGLLFDERFHMGSGNVRPQSQLPKLWRLMCDAITIIFRRTPTWSKLYEPEAMIDWMRDALIFGRDLVAQRRTFEAAAMHMSLQSKMTMASPRKPSQIGRNMLNDLQPVLTESIRWLRLTDMELLHQSSNLVQTLMDCFREADMKPSPDSLAKLEKFLDSCRRNSIPEDQRPRLSQAHLSELMTALSFFNQDDDDDIQIFGETEPSVNSKGASSHVLIAESSRAVTKPNQSTLMNFMNVASRKSDRPSSAKTAQGSKANSSKFNPLSDIKKIQFVSQSVVQTARAYPETAAQGMVNPSTENTLIHGSKLPTRPSQKESNSSSILKDDNVLAKSGVSQVASSSSSESEDEDGPGGLASLGKLQQSPRMKKPTQRRSVRLMEPKFTGHNAALDRIRKREEAQRAALRMKPDLRPLYRIILSWNYDHDGPEPPVVGDRPIYAQIADTFESDQEYQRIFEPLLTLECWNQLIKSKEEALPETFTCNINSRQYIDEWLDLDVSVTERQPERWRLAETDIVLLRKLASHDSILAKVQSSRKVLGETQATLRCLVNVHVVDPGLHINTQWRLTKVFSLSTIVREFAALKALPYFDFYPEIMRPRPAMIPSLPASQVQRAMNAYQVNKPQAIAILGSLQTKGFSLVQGPPGTGKTWTICGIVGAFLSSRPRPATIVQVGRNSSLHEKTSPLKMLVCAPSNAAIDEVAKRLKDGVRNSDGCLVVPNVVRVGAEEAINVSVKDVSLDQLVSQRLNADPKQMDTSSAVTSISMTSLRAEMDFIRTTRASKMQEMTKFPDNFSRLQALEAELKSLNNKRMSLSQQLNRLKDKQKSESRTLDAARRKYRTEVLMDADIICTTLSGAGHEVLTNLDFEMIVIDEAAQSIELSSLIPLKYGSKRCIMVGDPQQLPPTVLSPLANKFGYGQSLFVRLQKGMPQAVHLLSIQYRMHPDISRLPSKLFYAQRLIDGPGMAEKTSQLWHKHPLFGTYKFINVASGGEQQTQSGHSFINRAECEVAAALYNRIRTEYSDTDFDFRIGVITMYRAQLLELKKKFQAEFGVDVVGKVDFNTVDGFQGQEKDIIILSCVRAGPGIQSIGFLADQRRLNVAITRARASLFILGHAATLERSDQMWREIVHDARGTSLLLNVDTSTYRRTSNAATSSRGSVRPIPIPRLAPAPPQRIFPTNFQSNPPVAGPSSAASHHALNTHAGVRDIEVAQLSDDTKHLSGMPKKRVNPDDSDFRRPAPPLRMVAVSQDTVDKLPPPARKRPKEISMFIPKRKPDLKRPPDPDNNTQGGVKRRVTDQYYK